MERQFPEETRLLIDLLEKFRQKYINLLAALKTTQGWVAYQKGLISIDAIKLEEYIGVVAEYPEACFSVA